MELTIEQALQQAIAAHKEGKLQDAERLYRAILQSQPTHPDANHNLGVLAVSVDKTEAALPLFKTALEANSTIEQFWLSYIDALIKVRQFDSAEQVIEQAKKHTVDRDRLNSLTAKLSLKTQKPNTASASPPQELLDSLLGHYQSGRFAEAEKLSKEITQEFPKHEFAWKVLGAVLGTTGRKSEAVDANRTAVALSPQDAEPHNNLGNALRKLGRLGEAVASYTQAIALKPDFAEACYNLGVTLQDLGRLDEAGASYYQAVALKPDYAEAHNNLGNALQELGKLGEAVATYNQAIALKPNFAEARYNLGNTLQKLGRLDEAAANYTEAIALKPDFAEAHNNLGNALRELGRLGEAVASYTQAIELKPDFPDAHVNLGLAIKTVKFNSSNPKLYLPLTQLLTVGNYTRPSVVAGSILSLLKHHIQIKDLLLEKNFPASWKEAVSIIESLSELPLLHHLMRVCPLPELQFEKLFVAIRSLLLKNLDKIAVSSEVIYFLSTLSIHCFTNEYVYVESDEETHLIRELQAKISQIVSQSEQPEAIEILCLATYRPLHQYDWCQKLAVLDYLAEVKKRLIEEPLLEKVIAKDIPVLEEISDDVSLKVKGQYEENPYPRWVKTRIPAKGKSISGVCEEINLYLHSESIKNVAAPTILIAGCGTGQNSIEVASRFYNCHVTAVDLSIASLAYAKRKSNELGFTSIDYLQADILHLHKMGKEFDIIESGGVLHHMDEPMVGWRVIVDLLKPGGLMKIGLYSELARQHIVEAQKEIASLRLGTSATEIRNFRELSRKSEIHDVRQLSAFSDFFSLSEFRDLVFHVQEHHFTLPQIKNCLDKLGLKFCGFENIDIVSKFRELHRDETDIYDLKLWHQYEERNPRTFGGMYQFWCQKL